MARQRSWILSGARVALGPDWASEREIEIRAGKIRAIRAPAERRRARNTPILDLRGHLILPGLINAHDHLELNLFPRQGRGPYPNAAAWARDIYRPGEFPIKDHLRIPKATRLVWGGLKNLLSGVTTVCHHNPRENSILDRNFPVRVVKRFGWAHSLEFSPDLAERFRRTPPGWPFLVHLGEATDRAGRCEVFRLNQMGALDHRTVLVHAVALDRQGWRLVQSKAASVVWCPSSNLFLLGRTLTPGVLRSGILVALGTDSALTATGDLLDELRAARSASRLSRGNLYRMVTEQAAQVLRLEKGAGRVSEGGPADLVVVRDRGQSPAATLCGLVSRGPEMVMVAGQIKLVSPSLAVQLPAFVRRPLYPLAVEGRGKALVDADVPELHRRATRELGPEILVAGKRLLA